MTIVIYNSVLSSLLEDELRKGHAATLASILLMRPFTHTILALSYFFFISLTYSFDTAIYLLINNQFDITTRLDSFSLKAFDIQRMVDRYVATLDQQSSYLIKGDVRLHFVRMVDNIVDCTIWEEASDVWKYLGTPAPQVVCWMDLCFVETLYKNCMIA